MKVVMVMVSSLNGKTTRGLEGDIYEWSSDEDRQYFFNLVEKNNLIVMGSNTYNGVKSFIKLTPEKLRVVLTRDPEKYKKEEVPGSLEFTSEQPDKLVKRLDKTYKQMLLVGGAKTNVSFLEKGLVDEVSLTVEPKIFGEGIGLVSDGDFETDLELVSSKKMNKKGTLLLKYKVRR